MRARDFGTACWRVAPHTYEELEILPPMPKRTYHREPLPACP